MGHKLLLADDSITIQKVVGIIFSGEGYDLTAVDNGDDALRRLRESVPDVMLIDTVMPGKDGYEVCREVRKDPLLSFIPILLLTGVFDTFDETKAREAGADDFIAKPFESQVLIDKVKDLITLGEARRPATLPESPATGIAPVIEVVSPTVAKLCVVAEEPLEIEEANPLDDPWGMGLAVQEPSEEIPFGRVSEPQEGESLEAFELLEPLPVEGGFPPPPVAIAPPETAVEESLLEAEPEEVPVPVEAADTSLAGEEPADEEPAVAAEPVSADHPHLPVAPGEPSPVPSNAAPGVLTEEQLVAALSTVSREVIERIVWEVVPDLAETLIREEIRKLREGV